MPSNGKGTKRQAAALGYIEEAGRLTYVVVTSRRTGRWIFPKGGVDAGESAAAAAARELAEEAGALGTPRALPFGRYPSLKLTSSGFVTLSVDLYPVAVRTVLDDWQERAARERRILGAAEIADIVATPEMAELVVAFERVYRRGAA